MSSSTRGPQLQEVIDNAVRAALADVRVCLPARVVRYDASKQQVDCAVLIKQAFVDEDDARQVESLPVVPSVPVFVVGGGGYRATFPIQADPSTGDTCLLVFSPTSLDKWLTGSGAEVDPEIDDTHGALHNAIAIVGIKPFGSPYQSAPTDHATIGADTGTQVHMHSDHVTVADNETGAKAVGLDGDDVDMGLWGVTVASGAVTAVQWEPPGGGAPVTIAVGPPSTQLTGKLRASAAQLKAK